ncbi:P-loop containing nucleoside triphosphate hydrolase protein [Nemania serpens]|nr:P-loop containing nucleoside triphosphate hydrolase protein [Nemania serpens]
MANRFKSAEASISSLMENIAGKQAGSGSLQEATSGLICGHLDNLEFRIELLTDAVQNSEYTDEQLKTQINLLFSHIEFGFRDIVEDVGSSVQSVNTDYRVLLKGFESQVEQLQNTNAALQTTLNHLFSPGSPNASEKHEQVLHSAEIKSESESKQQADSEIELKAMQTEIERLKAALELAGSQKAPEDADYLKKKSSEFEQSAEIMQEREAALIAQHKQESHLFTARYRALVEELAEAKGNIRVLCRIRPDNAPDQDLLKFSNPDEHPSLPWSKLRVTYQNESKKTDHRDFNFKRAFGRGESNRDVFDEVSDFAKSAVFGNNACIMAYGATGTGKSYLFLSDDGLVQSYVALLFQLAEQERAHCEYNFYLSAVEIYLNKIFDLLQPPVGDEKAEVRLSHESTARLESREQAVEIIKQAIGRREAASTKQNATSSRSHFIISIKISRKPSGNEKATESTLSFTDLAGSEAAGKAYLSGGSGPRQALIYEQGQDINKGLLDLGKGIRSLAKRDTFVPSHNLTRVLRPTLSPGSRLLLVTTVSSLVANQSNTLTTLRWSQDAIGPSGSQSSTPARGTERTSPGNMSSGKSPKGNTKSDSSVPSVSSRNGSSSTRRTPPSNSTKR